MSRTTLLTLLVGLAAPALVHAQETVIAGTVTDTTDLVLPGVIVEARSTEADGPIEIGRFRWRGRVRDSPDSRRARTT